MKRRGIMLALLLAALGVSALAVDLNQLYNGVPMFTQLTRLPQSHPLCKMAGPQSKCYRATLTKEFSDLLENGDEFTRHKVGRPPGGNPPPAVAYWTTRWINPFWVSLAAGTEGKVTAQTTATERQVKATLTAAAPLQWMFAQGERRDYSSILVPPVISPLDWAAVGDCVDEIVDYCDYNGNLIETYTIAGTAGISLTVESGCPERGKWIQTVPADMASIKGVWVFKTMAIHAPGVENSQQYPVYDYRDGQFYICKVVIP